MRHQGYEFWEPAGWPLFWRRAFLLTLPISGPIWLALVILGAMGVGAIALVLVPFWWVSDDLVPKLWRRRPYEACSEAQSRRET